KVLDLGAEFALRFVAAPKARQHVASHQVKILKPRRRFVTDTLLGLIEIWERAGEISPVSVNRSQKHQCIRRIMTGSDGELRFLFGALDVTASRPDSRENLVRLARLDLRRH